MSNRDNYENMPHRFDPLALLVKALALKGLYYPGMLAPTLDKTGRLHRGDDFNRMPQGYAPRMRTLTGTAIRKTNVQGRVYFMPVELDTSLGVIELPAAAISIKGKKTIVETALTGRRGSVKELISVDDYEINLHGVIVSADANYPEVEVELFRDVFELNESIKLICALGDLVLQPADRIVLKTVDWPEVGAVEEAQVIHFTAVTDSNVELVID